MAHKLREHVAKKLIKLSPRLVSDVTSWEETGSRLQYGVTFSPTVHKKKDVHSLFHMVLPYKYINNVCTKCGHPSSLDTVKNWANSISRQKIILSHDGILEDIRATDMRLEFTLNKDLLCKETLQNIVMNTSYGYNSELHTYYTTVYDKVTEPTRNQTIVVEYSSPNTAKPFHAGHLRSTVIGNVIANLYEKLGHNVIRINYIGNWGTQFGLLAAGYEMFGNAEELETNTLKYLLKIYVEMNTQASENPSLKEAARMFNIRLEQGEEKAVSLWRIIMEKSQQEYTKAYQRLGIKFDVYDSEADQVKPAKQIINTLRDRGLLETKDGLGYVDVSEDNVVVKTHANVIHSDGTTFYLTRDISAAIERYNKYKFDRMFYVVEAGQEDHFRKLFRILSKLGYSWADEGHTQFHVPFGRIEKMSSRLGTSVLLDDLLNYAQNWMLKKIKHGETTKCTTEEEMAENAEILGVSSIIIQDLQSNRLKNYKFNWDRMTHNKGPTGVALQYTHARLYNVEENCGVELDVNCNLESLVEYSALNLVLHLAGYDQAINEAVSNLEAHRLVQYLFLLGRLAHSAIDELRVKDELDVDKAKARLLLFHCARLVLASGLETLGLTPLNQF